MNDVNIPSVIQNLAIDKLISSTSTKPKPKGFARKKFLSEKTATFLELSRSYKLSINELAKRLMKIYGTNPMNVRTFLGLPSTSSLTYKKIIKLASDLSLLQNEYV